MNNAANQHSVPAYVPPGWYPDPITGQGERYWDGIGWSREFTRPGPQFPAAPQHGVPLQSTTDIRVSEASPTLGSGLVAMVAAAALFVWRISYMSDYWQNTGTSSAYGQGALVGSAVGFFLTGQLFAWGLGRFNAVRDGLSGDEAKTSVGEAAPMALGIAVAGMLVSYVLGA